jgi:putative ABC transport system permease protein
VSRFATVRQAARSLARTPGFTFGVLATFALGIGVNTAVFSTAWSLLLGPLPLSEPERLVAVWETFEGNERRQQAPANFLDWRREAKTIAGAAAYFETPLTLDGDGEPRRVSVAKVSTQFFDVLGAAPAQGRFFHGGETGALVVVAEDFWEQELGGGRLDGRTLRLDGSAYQVVGVAPASFALPRDVRIWMLAERDVPGLPLSLDVDWAASRDSRYLGVYARLAPEATVDAADAELGEIMARLEAQYPDANRGSGIRVVPLNDDLGNRVAAPMTLLAVGSLIILLVTCSNVAGLLLARGMGRRRELAVRAALGAQGARLMRQVIAEVALLAVTGGALGLAVAAWGAPLLVAQLPGAEAAGRPVGVPLAVTLVAVALTLLAALAAAVTPAAAALRVPPAAALAGGRGALGVEQGRLRSALVVAQAALAVALVACSLLVTRTLMRMTAVDPGFDAENVTTLRLWAPSSADAERRAAILAAAVEAAAATPGVESAGAILKLPLTGTGFSAGLSVDGRDFPPNENPDVCWRAVEGDYFRTLGIALRAGRTFTDADAGAGPLLAVVNETLARQMWPREDPIGRRVRTGLDHATEWVTVVGVVADTPQDSLTLPAQAEMYRPLRQPNRFGNSTVALAARVGPGFSVGPLREALRAVSPELVVEEPQPLADLLRRATARERLLGGLLALFGGLALTLAGLGLHGVLALLVAERRREMGIRLAIGATARDLARNVLGRGVGQAALGAALGLAVALALGRALRAWLWNVSPADPVSLAVAAAALLAVAALAAWLPARRAARLDPAIVLREE